MADRRPTATTQSLSLNSYTGPDGSRVTGSYGTFFLGRYRVVDEIGVGGMASVHLARLDGAGGFQKWVAIKRIHPHLVEDDQFVHMFLDEARIAARISHANVAQVFELGEGEGNYWIAMEYLHGEPLREVMRCVEEGSAPMSFEVAAKVIADAAEGLHAAHDLRGKNGEALGLVHRDVTPHNLFVTYEGTVKVVDFGIAKVAGRLSSTRAGTLKGKLAYMSPEQVAGREIDRRTDIFALGVVLWELTTNQRLFRTDSDLETLEKVQACQVPRPSQIRRDYPPQLEQIILKALSRDANQRHQTARDLSRDLQKFLLNRGMLVGPENVSEYIHRIFGDRIRKRDEHLRWAAEVTQTINVDDFKQDNVVDTADVSAVTYNSEVMPTRGARNGPQSLPGPGPGLRAIEAGLPVAPPTPSASLPPPSSLPAPRPAAGAPAASLKGTVRLPAITPAPAPTPAPLPAFGAGGPPVSVRPPMASPSYPATSHSPYDDDDDENIETVVGPARSFLISEDGMPTIAAAHQAGAVRAPAAPIPAAGNPAPYAPSYSAPQQAAPSPYPAPSPQNNYPAPAPQNSYAAPAQNSYPAPSPQNGYPAPSAQVSYGPPPVPQNGYVAPAPPPVPQNGYAAPAAPVAPIADSPTYIPGVSPTPNGGLPPGVEAVHLQRDPTMQLPLVRQKRQMGMVAVASVLGTLVLVAGIAAMAFKMGGDKEAAAKANDTRPDATTSAAATATTATTATNTAAGSTVTAPVPTAVPTPTQTAPTPTATQTATSTPITSLPKPTSNNTGGGSPPVGNTSPPQPKPVEEKPKPAEGSGTISVVCSPACDSVTVKGRNLGPSPVINVSFPAGTYPVVLKRSGAPNKISSITVVAGKNTPLKVSM